MPEKVAYYLVTSHLTPGASEELFGGSGLDLSPLLGDSHKRNRPTLQGVARLLLPGCHWIMQQKS